MIKSNEIKNLETVKSILTSFRPIDTYIDTLNESDYRHEELCQRVESHLIEIDKALLGKEIKTMSDLAGFDHRVYQYWRYIGGKITFNKLIKEIKGNSNKLLLK